MLSRHLQVPHVNPTTAVTHRRRPRFANAINVYGRMPAYRLQRGGSARNACDVRNRPITRRMTPPGLATLEPPRTRAVHITFPTTRGGREHIRPDALIGVPSSFPPGRLPPGAEPPHVRRFTPDFASGPARPATAGSRCSFEKFPPLPGLVAPVTCQRQAAGENSVKCSFLPVPHTGVFYVQRTTRVNPQR